MALLIMQEHTDTRLCKPVKKRKTFKKSFYFWSTKMKRFLRKPFVDYYS